MQLHKAFLYSSLQIYLVFAAFNFNNYPECAQSLCYELAPPSCDFGSADDYEAEQTDACLCTNNGFISDLASEIYKTCGCQVLTTSAQVFNDNCAKYQTTSVISVEDFITEGDGGHTSCGSSGLDPGTIAGIVLGVMGVLVAIFIGVLQIIVGVLGLLPEEYEPWPYIQRFCCCCCCCSPRHQHNRPIPLPAYSP
jgi:hypothetical protein